VTGRPPPCARCGRSVRLWGLSPEGRICRNCVAIRNSAICGHCGEHRRVDGRDPDGVAWCARCRQHDRRVAVDAGRRQRIIDAVTAADPTIGAEVVPAVLAATVQSRASLRRLADHLDAHRDVFVVGPTTTLPILDRFTAALETAGAERIATIHPVCGRCGRRRRWHARTESGGECSACWSRTHREPCSVCGRARNVDHRDDHGLPVCEPCVQRQRRRQRLDGLAAEIIAGVQRADPSLDATQITAALDHLAPKVPTRAVIARQLQREPPLSTAVNRLPLVARLLGELRAGGASVPAARCEDCAGPAEPLVVYRDVVRCHSCAKRCPDCGGDTKEPLKARCGRCDRQPRGTCNGCGRVDRPLDDTDRCRGCRERAERRCSCCDQQAPRTWHRGAWLCQRCALAADLDDHLGPAGQLLAPLAMVRTAILAADNPTQVRKWLHSSTAGQVLARLATGETALTHDALDAHGAGDGSVGHLRALLVAAGALPVEDRSINRLEAVAATMLDGLDASDRKVMRAWLRWQVLPRLRARAEAGQSMAHSANNARRALRQVAAFLHRLGTHGRALRDCTQSDLDNWFAGGGANRWLARPFLVWATARGHLPRQVRVPACPPQVLRPALDGEQRWAIARRLVVDDTIDVADRVAAALVVLYGQPLARIATLKTRDIHGSPDGTTIVDLSGHPVPIHEPFATLIGQLPRRRSNGVSDQLDADGWLFPGRHAGRHTGPVALGERLRAIGIEPRRMRNSARAQLAAEIPPALLGELIGVNANTATRWAALTSGNWTAYAAEVAST
jgi:hypothetical protein